MVDIRISEAELNDPAIDEAITLEKSIGRTEGRFIEDVSTPFYLSPIFYYSLAALLGALAVWAIQEPFFHDDNTNEHIPFLGDYILFGPVAGIIGLMVGVAYGLANRNWRKAAYCGLLGVGIGLGATILTTFIADIVYGITSQLGVAIAMQRHGMLRPGDHYMPDGLAFWVQMSGRGLAWSIVSMGGGISLGIALKSRKLLLNGLAGAMVGGLLGGLFFDPIHRYVLHWGPQAGLSRAVGIGAVGLLVGFFIGLFENISKDAWFLMLRGPLSGKQFIIFKSPLVIGSVPKSDIYLFKDPAIEPRHASVVKTGSHYMICDEGSESGTFVNGKRVERYVLQPEDVISMGETVLKYHERTKN
jgi:hypothetical protein